MSRKWDDWEMDYIEDNYLHINDAEMGRRLRRTVKSVKAKRLRLRLERPRLLQYAFMIAGLTPGSKKGRRGRWGPRPNERGEKSTSWKGGPEESRKKTRLYMRKYQKAHLKENNARAKVHTAIKNGKLKRQRCEICGEYPTHGHHEDYSKPLKVEWLCSKHHRQRTIENLAKKARRKT